jgi:hypothetical protein
MGGRRWGAKGGPRGSVARGKKARQRRFEGWWCLCATRGGSWGSREAISDPGKLFLTVIELAGRQSRGGELRRDVGRAGGANEEEVGSGKRQEGRVALQWRCEANPRRRPAEAPAEREVEEGWEDLSAICEKSRGLRVN